MVTSLGEERMIDLLRGITSADRNNRLRACGVVSDVFRELADLEGSVLTATLTWAALVEQDVECREAQMYCLSTLVEWDLAPPHAYAALARIDRRTLRGSEFEYFDDLFPGQP